MSEFELLDKNEDFSKLGKNMLKKLHRLIHEAYKLYQKGEGLKNWSIEDYFNYHKLLVEEMERRHIPHEAVDDLDEIFGEVLASGFPPKGREITLAEVLQHFEKRIRLLHPYIYLVGGCATRLKTDGDIDLLIKGLSTDSTSRVCEFRIGRLFPPELRHRIHFVFDDTSVLQHGPVTSYVPLYSLELVPILPHQRVLMGKAEDVKKLELKKADKPLIVCPVMPPIELLDICKGVLLNAYNLREDYGCYVRDHFDGLKIMDNGAFGGHTLSVDELMEKAEEFKPTVVIAPDYLFADEPHKKSYEMEKKFLERFRVPGVEVMCVPQGRKVEDYEWCFRELLKLEPDWIGFGRVSLLRAEFPLQGMSTRIWVFNHFEEEGLFDECREKGIKLHALGLSSPHELPYYNYFGFTSADSVGYLHQAMGYRLVCPEDPSEEFFEFTSDGAIHVKKTDTEELLKKKEELVKEFLKIKDFYDRCRFVLTRTWFECAKLLKDEPWIERHVRKVESRRVNLWTSKQN